MTKDQILSLLPYAPPFLFVDEIDEISENGVKGSYTFPKDAFFYQGHFEGYPVTPGVILTEVMAQIGVVCLGIYLQGNENIVSTAKKIALSSHQVEFYRPVFPCEKVTAVSEKIYFRFGKLKCKVGLYNSEGTMVAKGEIAGMLLI